MKNVRKMTKLVCVATTLENPTSFPKARKGALSLAFLTLLVVGAAIPSHSQSTSSRELTWASDSTYGAIEIQSSCQTSDSKHAVWQTQIRNTTDSPIQLKTLGKTALVEPNSILEIASVSVKNCNRPLRLKLDARPAGDRNHYALDYNNGVVKAHLKSPTDWMGMTTAIMAGVSAGMGNPVAIPDPPSAPDTGDEDDSQ